MYVQFPVASTCDDLCKHVLSVLYVPLISKLFNVSRLRPAPTEGHRIHPTRLMSHLIFQTVGRVFCVTAALLLMLKVW